MRLRTGGMLVVAVLCAAVVGMSAAWACTGQPLMHLATDATGEARSPARVEVLANQAVAGPVTLRWNALDGPVLATADVTPGSAATLDATIPDAPPGVYYLVLNTSAGVARTAFQVTAPSSSPAPASPWASSHPAGTDSPVGLLAGGVALLAAGLVTITALTLTGLARRRRATSRA